MMETDTATTGYASSTIVQTQQTFDQFFTFDGGDVEIKAIFQGLKVTGKVASQVMVLASPVWKKFISPPWTVHTDTNHQIKTIDFTEDDGCALLILLRLAHLQTTIIPSKLGLDTLFQVAMQCEKYGCLALLHLILSAWLAAEQDEVVKDESGKWLYICWAFGLEKHFEEAALRMAKSGMVLQGEFLTSGGLQLSEPMPDKIIESIMSIRTETMQTILDLVYAEVKKYSDIKSLTTILCKHGRLSCDAMVYGSLLIGLQQRGLWPPVEAPAVRSGINSLAAAIRGLKIHSHPQTGGRSGPTHHECSAFRNCPAMEQVLRDMPSPVLDCHIIHMENRGKIKFPDVDPLLHHTFCARCSQTHSAMVPCPINEKKRAAPSK